MFNQLQRFLIPVLFLIPLNCLSQIDLGTDSLMVQQLNMKEKADAYPWLSADGLRLYFTAERENVNQTYFAERASIDDPFSNSRLHNQNFIGYNAVTLTVDERTIYLHKDGKIYVSTRKCIDCQFSVPVLVMGINEFVHAPAISPDGRELVVVAHAVKNRKDAFLHYSKNEEGKFVLDDTIPLLGNLMAQPGQFSKDGLSFYAIVERNGGKAYTDSTRVAGNETLDDSRLLVRYKRNCADLAFKDFEILPTAPGKRIPIQVTLNADETIMIGVISEERRWKTNELTYIRIRQEHEKKAIVKVPPESL
jgi:WD40-like Beta Propeller Repeat